MLLRLFHALLKHSARKIKSRMYQKISIITFLITICGIGLSYIFFPGKKSQQSILNKIVHLCTLPFLEQKLSLAGALRKLVYLLALLSFVVLGITGFYPTLVLGEHISGYLVMIHATFAPILAICLAIFTPIFPI